MKLSLRNVEVYCHKHEDLFKTRRGVRFNQKLNNDKIHTIIKVNILINYILYY